MKCEVLEMNNTVIKENDKMGYSVKEAFNALRTNFMFCGPDIKTVVVTSCIKSEGKSTVSIEFLWDTWKSLTGQARIIKARCTFAMRLFLFLRYYLLLCYTNCV